MTIKLTNVGKRFNREWIFRHLNFEFSYERSYAIIGPNGSGKSTLLQIIAGATTHSEGEIDFYLSEKELPSENIFSNISIAAPYLELVEEMTLLEFFKFHSALKPWMQNISTEKIIFLLGLDDAKQKQIRYFSSGMKQRVKLTQAIFSDVPVVLLDEPCTNLDEEGIFLYKDIINKYCSKRLLIISSNDKQEYDFCKEVIDMKEIRTLLSPAGNK